MRGLLLAEGVPNSGIDGTSPRGVGVQLATMHRAKGLEFRAVFIVGYSAEVLPQPYTGDEEDLAARTVFVYPDCQRPEAGAP